MDLAVVTPSYIDSADRVIYATRSIQSLNEHVGTDYPHIVVDDVPRLSLGFGPVSLNTGIAHPRWEAKAEEIYADEDIQLIRRRDSGSRSAMLRGIREARKQGADLVLEHKDDEVYIPKMGELVEHARDAFERDEDLMYVRFAGTPILDPDCTPEAGNLTHLSIGEGHVAFDNVDFYPQDYDGYTLWTARFEEDMIDERYWPIVGGWKSMYRINFWEEVLTFDEAVTEMESTAEVERYFKFGEDNWQRFVDRFDGKVGYINMQFGGLEMEKNQNWEELVAYPNTPLREADV